MTEELPLWAEIDLSCVRRNVERLKALLAPGTLLLAVVKADGYGHGDVEAAEAALSGGADWLGVARVHEGARLRQAGVSCPILLLAEPPAGAVAQAVSLDLTPTIYTEAIAIAFSALAQEASRTIPVHIKVDTGMHRYGVAPQDADAFFKNVGSLEGLQPAGVWSHFAVAEDVLNPFTKKQHERYQQVVESLGAAANGLIRHMSNSAAIMSFPQAHYDMVRAGIAIYGIHPSAALADKVQLEPAMSLKSRVGMVKQLEAGEAISYGQRYKMPADGTVATVPCGYADGLRRALGNRGQVLIGAKRYTIAGTVTMDHFLIDAGKDRLEAGDEVVIIGRQGSETITAQEVADRLDTIPYEIVCGISARVPRLYLK